METAIFGMNQSRLLPASKICTVFRFGVKIAFLCGISLGASATDVSTDNSDAQGIGQDEAPLMPPVANVRVGKPQVTAVPRVVPLPTKAPPATNVLTYHYDAQRTGWDQNEAVLTPTTVTAKSFGVLHAIQLKDPINDWVDAQPLVIANMTVNGTKQDVVYVATEANNIYAYSALTGNLLFERNLGTPVPHSMLPGGCWNNGGTVGINSTPVINLKTATLYVMSYKLVSNVPTYQLHALDINTLLDKGGSPTTVSASHTLVGHSTTTFDARYSRQRSALLLANGNVYAAFGSFCDLRPDQSRGWVLGWQQWNTNTMPPLPGNQLIDKLDKTGSPKTYFLSSIWMSGYGIAADPSGRIYAVTGNSDASTYSPPNHNLQESVVKLSANLTSTLDYFTPSGPHGYFSLDTTDDDLGAGGAMVVPDITGQAASTVVAGGKRGGLYLINRSAMGHNDSSKALSINKSGPCWCGPSYFMGSDGVRRVVSSGGKSVMVWKAPAQPATLNLEYSSSISSGQDGGFFTTISSNGTKAGTAIIWAVGRPISTTPPANVTLYAIDAASGNTLFSSIAGSWPNSNNNANIVPTVANGKVFVASRGALNIFGPAGTLAPLVVPPPRVPHLPLPSQIFGIVTSVNSTQMMLQPQTGAPVPVDITLAEQNYLTVPLVVGKPVHVFGPFQGGVWHAERILRAKDSPESWIPTE